MAYQIQDFSEEHIDSAAEIFFKSFLCEKEENDILPVEKIKDSRIITTSLKSKTNNPGVAVVQGNELIGYMVTGANFDFKGQKSALISEYGHGAVKVNRDEIYKQMYMRLSAEWIKNGIHLHIIGHFSGDQELKETLFQLGFGAILSEKIRDLTSVKKSNDPRIKYENNPAKILEIQLEHNEYYRHGPIFIRKDGDPEKILAELMQHRANGDEFIVYRENNETLGYFVVGESNKNGEGFLLQDTNTAQVKSAYVKPFLRGKGIGTSLLDESINWAKRRGFERLFVEHETANYYGGNFWTKRFSPYLYFSMRYIDNTI